MLYHTLVEFKLMLKKFLMWNPLNLDNHGTDGALKPNAQNFKLYTKLIDNIFNFMVKNTVEHIYKDFFTYVV